MARTRLNSGHREELESLAEQIIATPKETDNVNRLYALAYPGVMAAVEHRYPPKDMAVLKRYECAGPVRSIKVQSERSVATEFDIRKTDRQPIQPSQYSYSSLIFIVDHDLLKLAEELSAALVAQKDARKRKLADYKGFISASRFFEDVVEIWPEAEQLRGAICRQGSAVTVISPELIARLKADVKSRAA